jgi:signal transduction histidine kinase
MSRSRMHRLPGGWRSPVIVLMLLASLALVGVLGWQSWRLQRSNASVAESVLREYAALAVDEFARRATTTLGYRGYYPLITAIADSDAPAMRAALNAGPDPQLASLVSAFFVVTDQGARTDTGETSPALAKLLGGVHEFVPPADAPYYSLFSETGREQAIFAVTDDARGRRRSGFIVAAGGVSAALRAALAQGPLLPPSLGGGRVSNDMFFLRVRDPAGDTLYEVRPEFASVLTVEHALGDDYQGILSGYTIAASLDPSSAPVLVIGGLPESRLPLLLLLMLIVVVLLGLAIWLIRREQAVMAMRADFVSHVSHELRTPLTQIRMFAETLLLGRARNNSDRIRALRIINGEAQRLTHLVDNILRFSTGVETAQVRLHRQPLAPLIREVCAAVQATAKESCLALDLEEDATGVVDPGAMRQVLLNLVDNALKYGPKRQQVTIALCAQGDTVRLSVTDEGPGIPDEDRERVWSAFYRLDREQDAAISGTGIGLAVVRELVEAMHGRCHVANGEQGAELVVELPSGAGHA